MKVAVYDIMDYEKQFVEDALNNNLLAIPESISENNCEKVIGYDAISVNGNSVIDKAIINKLHEFGIKGISTRTVGYDHIDYRYAASLGIKVFASNLETSNVSDFTIMMMLCLIRNANKFFVRNNNKFSLDGLCGKELRSCTVGIIGTGRVGKKVIKALQGFGCKILANDLQVDRELDGLCKYVTFEDLVKKSDIISLHVPCTNKTTNLINKDTISSMKDGVMIINTARGELIDNNALLEALNHNKVFGAALDVIKGEEKYVHNCQKEIDVDSSFNKLIENEKVIYSPHCAFFTEEVIKNIFYEGITMKGIIVE